MKVLTSIYNQNINRITNLEIRMIILSFVECKNRVIVGLIDKEWTTATEEYYRFLKRNKRSFYRYISTHNCKWVVHHNNAKYDNIRQSFLSFISTLFKYAKDNKLSYAHTVDELYSYNDNIYIRRYKYDNNKQLISYNEIFNNTIIKTYIYITNS